MARQSMFIPGLDDPRYPGLQGRLVVILATRVRINTRR